MAKTRDPLLDNPTTIDVLYLLGIFVAFVSLSFIKIPILYVVYSVLLWSIYQDWRSARVAEIRQHWYFLISDLLTVLNYISLFIALTTSPNTRLGYSEQIWLHWGLVFLIYIIWNLVMRQMPDTDKSSKKFFLNYSILETPIVVYCFIIYLEAKLQIILDGLGFDLLKYSFLLLIIMAITHSGILFYWAFQTYRNNRNSIK